MINTTQIILSIIILLAAVPTGLFLAHLTKDEKNIYKKPPYFPTLLWILAILSAIFYSLNLQIALTLTFIFITILIWNRN